MGRISNAERSHLFGPPGDRSQLVTVDTPWGIRVAVHEKIAATFVAACREADRRSRWKPRRIDSFNPRPIRGSTAWSIHSWALAFDFFATGPNVPPPGGVWTPANGVPADFASAFTDLGFTWGATFSRKDVPHIEWAAAPPTGTPTDEGDDLMPNDAAEIIKNQWNQAKVDQDRHEALLKRIDSQTDQIDRYSVWQMRQAGVADADIRRILGKDKLPPA